MQPIPILFSILAIGRANDHIPGYESAPEVFVKPDYYFVHPKIGRMEVPHWADFERFHSNRTSEEHHNTSSYLPPSFVGSNHIRGAQSKNEVFSA